MFVLLIVRFLQIYDKFRTVTELDIEIIGYRSTA